MISKWETVEKISENNFKIFTASMYTKRHPIWKKYGRFVVLDSPQWVNIIPLTVEKEVILIEQYRHGSDSITLEVPGGLVEKGEEPRLAAERECLEETGFGSDEEAVLLGETMPNPAFLNNTCFSFVWFNCYEKSAQKLDGNEEINITKVPLKKIPEMIISGQIRHSLVMNAFYYYTLKFRDI